MLFFKVYSGAFAFSCSQSSIALIGGMILILRSKVNFEFRREQVLVFCIKKRMLLLSEFHQNMKFGKIATEGNFEGVRVWPVVFTPLIALEGLLPPVLFDRKRFWVPKNFFNCGYRLTCDGGFFGFIVIPHCILTLTEKKSLNSYKALSYNSFFLLNTGFGSH